MGRNHDNIPPTRKTTWSELSLRVCVCIGIYTQIQAHAQRHMHPFQGFCYWLPWEQHFICVKVNWWQTRNKLQFLALWLPSLCLCQCISLGNGCNIANLWAMWKMAASVTIQPPRQTFPLSSIWQNFNIQITLYLCLTGIIITYFSCTSNPMVNFIELVTR